MLGNNIMAMDCHGDAHIASLVGLPVVPVITQWLLLFVLRLRLFRETLSEKVHATIPKSHCSSKKLERMALEVMDVCLRLLKESNKGRFDSYSVRNAVLILSHITFRDCRVHIFSENLSRNSCILRREASKYISSAMNQPCGWYLYIIHKIYTVKAVSIFIFEFKTVQAVT